MFLSLYIYISYILLHITKKVITKAKFMVLIIELHMLMQGHDAIFVYLAYFLEENIQFSKKYWFVVDLCKLYLGFREC